MNLFECKISYLKQAEDGNISKKNELYLVDAMTFTEAEARLHSDLSDHIPEFDVIAMKTSNINDFVIDEVKEKFFKSKISFVSVDMDSGKEKKMSEYILTQSDDFDEAKKTIAGRMEGSIMDFEIDSITRTNIIDIIQRPIEA